MAGNEHWKCLFTYLLCLLSDYVIDGEVRKAHVAVSEVVELFHHDLFEYGRVSRDQHRLTSEVDANKTNHEV